MQERIRQNIMKQKRSKKSENIIIYGCLCAGILFIVFILAVNLLEDISFVSKPNLSPIEYPQSLIDLLGENSETEDFVINYPQNKDKNFEIDLSDEVVKGTIPLFLQWDERWGYENYGSDFFAVTGCGPTCLSMVRCGLSGETQWNPLAVANMAEKQGYYLEGTGTSWALMEDGASDLGLVANQVILDENRIIAELNSGKPIICSMAPGDFTTTGHFIVLTGIDKRGRITICDPNSRENSEKRWNLKKIIPQIKNMWSYTYIAE